MATIAQADAFNARRADWLALVDADKTHHLAIASVYFRARYGCADADLTDPTTAPEAVRDAVCELAYQAFANLASLWPSAAQQQAVGRVIEQQTVKAGPLEKTTKYADEGGGAASASTGDTFPYVSALVNGVCALRSAGAGHGVLPLGRT